MGKKLGIRAARRLALEGALAFVENSDFTELFGDEVCDQAYATEDGEDILHDAQQHAANRIRKLLGAAP